MINILLTKNLAAVLDDIDSDLSSLKWFAHKADSNNTYYAVRTDYTNHIQTSQRMHRIIYERILGRKLFKYEYVDHIDGNGLNNRRENLRLATNAQNQANSIKQLNCSSIYKGVDWYPKYKKWRSRITKDQKQILLGYFTEEKEAALAYNIKAVELFGEYAKLNNV